MCHYRGSYVSEERAKAEAARRSNSRPSVKAWSRRLRREADKAAQDAVAVGKSAKETAPGQIVVRTCVHRKPLARGEIIPSAERCRAGEPHLAFRSVSRVTASAESRVGSRI